MNEPDSEQRPLRVAIIGSGPSGFYAAEALFKTVPAVTVDMFDRLPTPFGLVRGGVAPDHPKIKTAVRVYEKIADRPDFRLLGNVTVGEDISIDELRRYYDAILLAYGASADRRLGIPGEDLPGSHTATEFVGWYNGHPDYRDRVFDLSQETAVVIGQGNVAVDVARILCKTPDELRGTDIAAHALEALAHSRIRHVYIVGRRGPVQARFTPQELRELGRLEATRPEVADADLALDPLSEAELADKDNLHSQRNMAVLQELAAMGGDGAARTCHIRFFRGPVAIQGATRVEQVVLEKTVLSGAPFRTRAEGTGLVEAIPCGLVFRSVGYRGVALPGVPFDAARGIVPNDRGRVLQDGVPVPGLYVTGWIKRGPSGVIGTNKPDSYETAAALVEDRAVLPACPESAPDAVTALLASRGVRVVGWEQWRRIDAAEVARGAEAGKPREKFTRIAEMLDILQG